MNNSYPVKFFISSGIGRSTSHKLVAFDECLRTAGISEYNLLRVSSILPSGVMQVSHVDLKKGSPLLTAYAQIDSCTPGDQIATAVGAAIPLHETDVGIIMEYESHNCSSKEAESIVRDMIKEAMNNHGIEYKEIITSATEATITIDDGYVSLISAISFW